MARAGMTLLANQQRHQQNPAVLSIFIFQLEHHNSALQSIRTIKTIFALESILRLKLAAC